MLRPSQMHQLQLVQTVTVVLLIYSVIAGLVLQEFGDEAFQAGLAAVAMVMGTARSWALPIVGLWHSYCLQYVFCDYARGCTQDADHISTFATRKWGLSGGRVTAALSYNSKEMNLVLPQF